MVVHSVVVVLHTDRVTETCIICCIILLIDNNNVQLLKCVHNAKIILSICKTLSPSKYSCITDQM